MAWSLARIIGPEGERWRISVAGAERIDHLPHGDELRPGELVLLEGEPGDWRGLRGPLHAGAWSSDWQLQALTPEERSLSPLFSARGDWVIDPAGLPVEHGLLRVGPDSFAHVLSYAGWRLGDLEGQELNFEQYTSDDLQLLVLRAEGCPLPEDAGEALPRDPLPHFEEVRPVVVGLAAPSFGREKSVESVEPPELTLLDPTTWQTNVVESDPPPPLAILGPTPVDVFVRFSLVIFGIEELEAQIPGLGLVRAVAPWSRKEFDALKNDIEPLLSTNPHVRITGTVDATSIVLSATEPPELWKHFKRARWDHFIREYANSNDWIDLAEILNVATTDGDDHENPFIGLPEFGLAERHQALRVLFRIRSPEHRVLVLPKAGAIFVVEVRFAFKFVVWESLEENNATYVFQWRGEAVLEKIKDLTCSPNWRQSLQSDHALKQSLGFSKKVIHKGKRSEDALTGWRERLHAAIGL